MLRLSIIVKSSAPALMCPSGDGSLLLLPIHQHLDRLAQLDLPAVLPKQTHDPTPRPGSQIRAERRDCLRQLNKGVLFLNKMGGEC